MTAVEIVMDHIPDSSDFTETRYIAARARLHSGVFITFRPTDIMQSAMLLEVRSRVNEAKFVEVLVRELSKRITDWSLTMLANPSDPTSGEMVPMPVTEKFVKTLRPILLNRIFDIVIWGADGGDVPPDQIEPVTGNQDEFESRLQSMLEATAAS